MHRTSTDVRPAGRFSRAAERNGEPEVDPAWRPWLRLVDRALRAAEDPHWARLDVEPPAVREGDAPLLHGAVVHVDARRIRRLLRELLREAEGREGARCDPSRMNGEGEPEPKVRARRLDAMGALRAAIAQDAEALERIAGAADVDAGRLAVAAQLAATPILRGCATGLGNQLPEGWLKGYCPICGAWPATAELRGLERSRRLRCGRCACDWMLPVLQCPFCDERNHDHLRSLLPEGSEQTRRIDACETCKGYVKTFSTLQAMSPRALARMDLATVELDMAAEERGYSRPSHPAFAVEVTFGRTHAASTSTARDHE